MYEHSFDEIREALYDMSVINYLHYTPINT